MLCLKQLGNDQQLYLFLPASNTPGADNISYPVIREDWVSVDLLL